MKQIECIFYSIRLKYSDHLDVSSSSRGSLHPVIIFDAVSSHTFVHISEHIYRRTLPQVSATATEISQGNTHLRWTASLGQDGTASVEGFPTHFCISHRVGIVGK